MDADTEIGGANARFPETRHSAIAAAVNMEPERRTLGQETIVAAYWKPVYRYIRVRWRKSNEDAKDLTQQFFALALEKSYFQNYDAGKGTFRTWLRTCLDRFLANEHKSETCRKRGPATTTFDLDTLESPDTLFGREWERFLFETAIQRLRIDLHERGRDLCFTVFERYDLAEDPPAYDALAREFNIATSTVTNYLAAARRELRRLVLEELRSIVPNSMDFRREARALLK